MGASKEDFTELREAEEIIRAEMRVDDYFNLSNEQRDKIDIKTIDVQNFDYSEDEQWQALKKKSLKAYKDLKKREFELRTNHK